MTGFSARRRPPHPGKPAWPTPQPPRQRTVNRRFELRPRWWRRLMPWLIAAILSLATPAPADEVELPRTGVSPATTFWVLDTPTSGRWVRTTERYYTLTWYEAEDGSLTYDATEVSYEEMRQAEEYSEQYGG